MVQTLCSQAFSHNGDPCVTPDKISQTVLLPDLFDKPLVATFNREQASSDGGGVLLKAAERVYGLVKAFAGGCGSFAAVRRERFCKPHGNNNGKSYFRFRDG